MYHASGDHSGLARVRDVGSYVASLAAAAAAAAVLALFRDSFNLILGWVGFAFTAVGVENLGMTLGTKPRNFDMFSE